VNVTRDELRLLRTYVRGPRIWDAATALPLVRSLHQQKLIEPHPDPARPGVYQITAAGREALEDQPVIDHSQCAPATWSHRTHNHEGQPGAWLFPSETGQH
jgi:hypothetical protein